MLFSFGISIEDLYDTNRLHHLHKIFEDFFQKTEPTLFSQYRKRTEIDSNLSIDISIVLERFLCILFSIDENLFKKNEKKFQKIFSFNESFVKRRAILKDQNNSYSEDFEENFSCDEGFVDFVERLLLDESTNEQMIKEAENYAASRANNNKKDKILFHIPKKINPDYYFDAERQEDKIFLKENLSNRKGFDLTDDYFKNKETSYYQSKYCLHCHKRNKDSCSKGLSQNQIAQIKNHNGVDGCPLRQKISESNFLISIHHYIAALAIIMIDNPMCCGTGHRICIDCSQSCIFQKQDPVDIPLIESHLLDFVLDLNYGFEIYSLLSRWNPIKIKGAIPAKDSGKKILIVGLGPAGYTLAHYLLNDGHCVVAIDALRIESISKDISGIDKFGKRCKFKAIKNFKRECFEKLDERIVLGIGGVAEYGITSRWNKNNLMIVYLLLNRRKNFRLFGGVRFGSNITLSDAFNLGFQHVCLAIGGNIPKISESINWLCFSGVMFASDFLMSLHMNTPYRENSISNIHINSPIIIVGGGLTAVDAATESIAYYFAQVEKFSKKYNEVYSSKIFKKDFQTERDFLNAKKFLKDFEKIKKLRSIGLNDSQIAIKMNLATIVYRKQIIDCSAYKNNPKELYMALKEGVTFMENIEIISVAKKKENLVLDVCSKGNRKKIVAGCVLLAMGNDRDEEFLRGIVSSENNICYYDYNREIFDNKSSKGPIFLNKNLSISCFGDVDSRYSGSVVKAMASAKYGYEYVTKILSEFDKIKVESSFFDETSFFDNAANSILAVVESVANYSSNGTIISIKSYLAAKNFKVGSFYKLQRLLRNTEAQCEGVALSCYKVESDKLFFAVEERGISSKMIRKLKPGERVLLMGPLGAKEEGFIERNIVLIGGGVGNAALIPIGNRLKSIGCKVIHFASFRSKDNCFDMENISNASNLTIWSSDCNDKINPIRKTDFSFSLKLFDSIENYSNIHLLKVNCEYFFNLKDTHLIFLAGSTSMMGAFKSQFNGRFKKIFGKTCKIITSVNAPMNCAIGACGRCISKTSDGRNVLICRKHCYDIFDINMDIIDERLMCCSLEEMIFSK